MTIMPTHEGNNCLGIAQDHAIPPRPTKRLLEENGSDTDKPAKKRPKTSEEDDLTRDHLAAFLEDTRATGKAGLWYDAHQKLYDHLKERRAKMREDTSIHHAVDTPSQVAAHSDSDISEKGRGPSRNFFEVLLLNRLETALEQHYRQHHDKNRPNTAEDPRSTTDSPPSNFQVPGPTKFPLSLPPSPPSAPVLKTCWDSTGSRRTPLARARPRDTLRRAAQGEAPRAVGLTRTSSSITASRSPITEPVREPKPEPSPSSSPKSNNSGRAPVRPRAVPGTKAERLASQCMRYWPRLEELDKDEEDHED